MWTKEQLNKIGLCFFIFSAMILAGMMSPVPGKMVGFSMLAALAAVIALTIFILRNHVYRPKPQRLPLCLAGVFSIYYMNFICQDFMAVQGDSLYRIMNAIKIPQRLLDASCQILVMLCAFMALFAVWVFFYVFIDAALKAGRSLYSDYDRTERRFLICFLLASSGLILLFYSITNVFYCPISVENGFSPYDVVYVTDSGAIFAENTFISFMAPQNDIRQPLFWLFSLPFSLPASLLSQVLFFIPESQAVCLSIVQAFLLINTGILVEKMLRLQEREKTCFLFIFMFSFPSLIFLFTMEQYIISTFWLLLFLYAYSFRKNGRFLAVSAAGSLLTSGISFFLLREKTVKGWARGVFQTGICFGLIIIISGQLPKLGLALDQLQFLSGFTGETLSLTEKLLQYLNFAASCFFAPVSGIDFDTLSYQMHTVTSVSIKGVVILLGAVVGYVLNYKNEYAKICIGWIAFSFLLLCVIGWGTAENGLVIYTLYFSWSFLSLIYMGIAKLFSKKEALRRWIYLAVVIALFICNASSIWSILKFGYFYYPV